jgi:hypothetical protein
MVLDARDQERVRFFNEQLTGELKLRLVITSDPRSLGFQAFAEEFSNLAAKVRFIGEIADTAEPPALIIANQWRYHALPLSSELDPFLYLLSLLDRREPPAVAGALRQRLKEIGIPGHLQVYIAPRCPFCPQVVKQVLPLPLLNPLLRVTVIDGLLFAEMAQQSQVKSSPTVILDEEFRWIGQVRLEELVDSLVDRDPTHLDSAMLEDMLKEGNASQLATMMLRREALLPAFLPLLVHAEWSVRLGAMVVLEEIATTNRPLAQQALDPLWQQLGNVERNIQGDIIYLLGQIGNPATAQKLAEVFRHPATHEELREVLEEAMETLKQPRN